MLFMGEEWGATTPWQFFTSHPEPELGKATAEGRIGEFAEHGWDADVVPDPQDPETFTRSKLDWSELDQEPHDRLLAVHRALLALRRAHPDLVDADLSGMAVSWDDADRWLVVHRGSLRVVVNLAEEPREIDLDVPATDVLFATGELPTLDGETVTLPAESAAVLSTRLTMRRLLPDPGAAGRRRPGGGLPAAARAGRCGSTSSPRWTARSPSTARSAGLGSPGDKRIFDLLRALADVGAGRARDGVRRGLRADRRPTPGSAGCARRSADRRPPRSPSSPGGRRSTRAAAGTGRLPHDPGHLRGGRRRPAGGARRRRGDGAGLRGRRRRPARWRSTRWPSWATSRCSARAGRRCCTPA